MIQPNINEGENNNQQERQLQEQNGPSTRKNDIDNINILIKQEVKDQERNTKNEIYQIIIIKMKDIILNINNLKYLKYALFLLLRLKI